MENNVIAIKNNLTYLAENLNIQLILYKCYHKKWYV